MKTKTIIKKLRDFFFFADLIRENNLKLKSELDAEEKKLLARIVPQGANSKEIKWFKRQLKMFDRDDELTTEQAMENLLRGYKKR